MNQEILTFPGMETDHRQWDHVHSTWRVDIERWQRDHKLAVSQLAKLQEMLRQHGEALESHEQTIERHQQDLRDHDRAMSEYRSQGVGEILQEKLASKHRELAERHETQYEAHVRIRKHHYTVMARLAKLEAAIEAAM